jgi:predicted PurR-regulated permease PerM
MSSPILNDKQETAIATSIEAVIRIGFLLLIVVYCLQLLMPFAIPVLWGAIIAVALYPLFLKISGWLGGRTGLTATLISLVLITLILGPTVALSESLFEAIGVMADRIQDGNLVVPPPPSNVADWPVIGQQTYEIWTTAHENLEAFVSAFQSEILAAASSFLSLVASAGSAVLFTVISIAIAGAFMAKADVCVKGLTAFGRRLAGETGAAFVGNSALIVKSVATGVIGVAVIQAALGAIGMVIVGVPLTALWTLILLMLAIAQIPALLIMGPVAVYVFSTSDGVTGVIFAIWAVFVSVSDGFLKPILLGRGVSIPTLVILLGAIGGMILQGIIGLFIGAVVLALAWELLVSWVEGEVDQPEMEGGGSRDVVSEAGSGA